MGALSPDELAVRSVNNLNLDLSIERIEGLLTADRSCSHRSTGESVFYLPVSVPGVCLY